MRKVWIQLIQKSNLERWAERMALHSISEVTTICWTDKKYRQDTEMKKFLFDVSVELPFLISTTAILFWKKYLNIQLRRIFIAALV